MFQQRTARALLSVVADCASLLSAVALVSIAVLMAVGYAARGGARQAPGGEVGRPPQPRPVSAVSGLETTMNSTTKHSPGAGIAIVEFSDFQCPFCGQYAREVYPRIKAEFVDTGQVAYVFRNFPLETIHGQAFKAGEAAECAREQARYWDMHGRLFSYQNRLSYPDLLDHATALRLDKTAFESCLRAGRPSHVKDDQLEGVRLGIRSTPTFFIGLIEPDGKITPRRRIMGVQPYETFKAAIEHVRATRVAMR